MKYGHLKAENNSKDVHCLLPSVRRLDGTADCITNVLGKMDQYMADMKIISSGNTEMSEKFVGLIERLLPLAQVKFHFIY